jgi:hypothetical protein
VSFDPAAQPDHEQGRVRISIVSASGGYVTITRTHPSGRVVTVRGMDVAPLSGGAFIGWDYEAPIGLPVTYQAYYYSDPDTLIATSNTVTVTWVTENDWLKDPLEPIRNVIASVGDMSTYGYDTPTGVHTVLGRPDPVTVGEIRRAATGDLTLNTYTREERDRVHYITASGHTLLVQSSQESGVGSMYISLLGVTETRPSGQRDEPMRIWTLSYQEVAAPVGAGAAFTTWADVLAQAPDWQSIIDSWNSWIEMVEGIDSVTGPPILVWRGS